MASGYRRKHGTRKRSPSRSRFSRDDGGRLPLSKNTSVNAGERPNRRRLPIARQPRGFRKWRGSENGGGAAPRRVWWPRRGGCQPRATFVPSRRAATEPSGFPRQRIKKACPRRKYYCRYLFILLLYTYILCARVRREYARIYPKVCVLTMCYDV